MDEKSINSGLHISENFNINKFIYSINHTTIKGDNMNEWVIVKTKIKEMVGTYSVSADFSEELNKKVKQMIQDAVKRAEANGRRTVMGRDI